MEVLLLYRQERGAGLLSHAKPIQARRNGDSTQMPTEVKKAFLPRRSLYLYRLIKRVDFICSPYSLEKISKLIAYAKDK